MKCGREVAEDQLGRPAKEVRKRGYVPSGKDRPLEGLEDDQVSCHAPHSQTVDVDHLLQ